MLHDDDFLRISARNEALPGTDSNVLLSFTGVGHRMGGIDVQRPEFFGSGRSFDNIVFVTDKTRSWGNRISLQDVAKILAPVTARARVSALGNSMGGFLAIAASAEIDLETVIAFVPQFTIDHAVAPIKPNWRTWLGDISGFSLRDLSGAFVSGCRYWIFSGSTETDTAHAALFPQAQNVRHFRLPESEHNLARDLKARGALYPLISGAFEGRLDLGDVRRITGMEVAQLSPAR